MSLTVKEATKIIWSLSEPSKMPGYGYGLPISACKAGSKLRLTPGTGCAICYAGKGHYAFKPVIQAQQKRLEAIKDLRWVQAMITVLRNKKCRYFRWHDSGDLQGVWHLKKIVDVAKALPDMQFWLPTKESTMLAEYVQRYGDFPDNLVVRLSAPLIDTKPVCPKPLAGYINTCTIHDKDKVYGMECLSYTRQGKCGECRACWDPEVHNVSYRRH